MPKSTQRAQRQKELLEYIAERVSAIADHLKVPSADAVALVNTLRRPQRVARAKARTDKTR
jgi:hypothetical protein